MSPTARTRSEYLTLLRARFAGAVSLTPAFVLAVIGAYWLRFEAAEFHRYIDELIVIAPLAVAIKIFVFGLTRVTRAWHEYVSFTDLLRLGRALAVGAAFLALADTMYRENGLMPRSIIVIDACLTAMFVGGMLSVRRAVRERRMRKQMVSGQRESVLIVGLNESGDAFLKAIRAGLESCYYPAGLVATKRKLVGREINGVPVVATLDNIIEAAAECQVQTVLVVGKTLNPPELRQLIADCQPTGLKVRVLPSVEQLVSGQVNVRPREVAIEDLLGRDAVSLDQEQLQGWLTDRVLMVTGSCGSIGSEIARQLLKFNPRKLILVDRSETGQFHLQNELRSAVDAGVVEVVIADIGDKIRMQSVISQHEPKIMFHAAAYKHVPLMESHPVEAVKNITKATVGLVELAHANDFESFVMISTDKAVNPTNVMGCCKRVAELYVQAKAKHSSCRFVTVRFGNVLGSAGSVIPTFMCQILEGGPVTVTHPDMQRYFMTIPEASQLVIQAGAMGNGGEIFVLDMGEPVKIVDLAMDLIRLSGFQVGSDIEIAYTGLRPGEKMYEELYIAGEQRCQTVHPKILVAESEQLQFATVLLQVNSLIDAADESPESIRPMLQAIVPRYQQPSEQPVRKVA